MRRSHGTPAARSSGPVTPSASRSSLLTTPVCLVRWSQISFWSSRFSYWSIRPGSPAMILRHFSSQPGGMSSITPPTWK